MVSIVLFLNKFGIRCLVKNVVAILRIMRERLVNSLSTVYYLIGSFLINTIFLVVWEYYSKNSNQFRFLFSSPTLIYTAFLEETLSGNIINDFSQTAFEISLSFIIGFIIGFLLSIILNYIKLFKIILTPYLFILNIIPIFILAPIVIVWFGVGTRMRVFIGFIGVFLYIVNTISRSFSKLNSKHMAILNSISSNHFKIFNIYILPTILDDLINSMKGSIRLSVVGIIIGEFIASQNGLGRFILKASYFFNMTQILVGVIYIIILCFTFEILIYFLQINKKTILSWFI